MQRQAHQPRPSSGAAGRPVARPPAASRRRWPLRSGVIAILILLVVAGAAAIAGLAMRPLPPPPPAAPPRLAGAGPAPAVPSAKARPMSTADLLSGHSADWRVARWQDNQDVLVIEFPGLPAQGRTMNRLAALLEKADAPRDRVLDDAQLDALIAKGADSASTFYQGHDYDGAGLARFFGLARQQAIPLNEHEQRLLRTLQAEGVLQAQGEGWQALGHQALVTFTAVQPDDPATPQDESIDARRRASILRHELSHGVFFTRPAYRERARRFWRETLTEPLRERLRAHLARLGYDRTNEELMLNETQALMMHTEDNRAFDAAVIGLTDPELSRLRERFWHDGEAVTAAPAATSRP